MLTFEKKTNVSLEKVEKSSVVILANNHNPTILTHTFLKDSGILKDDKEITKNSYILTPPLSRIIVNGITIQVENQRCIIEDFNQTDKAFEYAQKYKDLLGYISVSAIGINFIYRLSKDQFNTKIEKLGLKTTFALRTITLMAQGNYDEDKNPQGYSLCNIKLDSDKDTRFTVEFNFHYDFMKLKTQNSFEFDFVKVMRANILDAKSIYTKI